MTTDYKQTQFLSPEEREVINTLMAGNADAADKLRSIFAKVDETNYLFKMVHAASFPIVEYTNATTVTVDMIPWAYDQLAGEDLGTQLDAGIEIENLNMNLEPKAMLVNPSSITMTAVITGAGAGGLDTGAEAISTWYYVFLIGSSDDATDVDMILSASSDVDDVTLPTGYDLCTRIGQVFNDAAGSFAPFEEVACLNFREYWFVPYKEVLTNGASTSWAQVSSIMPLPDVQQLLGTYLRFSLDAVCEAEVGPSTGSTFFNLDYALDSFHYNNEFMPNVVASEEIWYKITSGGGETMDIFINGFKYSMFS